MVDSAQSQYLTDIERVARETAGPAAGSVDCEARFPSESFAALKAAGALGAAVPVKLGGGGIGIEAIGRSCAALAGACAATGMIFAMHQIQVLLLVRHLDDAPWFEDYLRRIAAEQRLIASATSERGTGGDMSRSIAAVESAANGSLTFTKRSTVLSYGADADDYLSTLRRSPESEETDQVLVLSLGEQTTVEQTGSWDTLGMRGTCSPPFDISATFAPQQVLPTPFARTMNESMVPLSHLLWAYVWLGIATDAFERAHACVRARARTARERAMLAGQRLAGVAAELALLRAEVGRATSDFERIGDGAQREAFSTLATILRFNNLKLAASEQAVRVALGALDVIGIEGYRADTPHSVERHLRDVLSAPIQVTNERILETNARLLLIAKESD